jgi:hypothetical protein
MMRNIFLVGFVLSISLVAKAFEPRNLLQQKATLQHVKASLVPKNEWIKYPAYKDRAAWDAFTGSIKERLIAKGENFLSYEWKVIKATDYLEYERSGSRTAMEGSFGANTTALSHLVFAELAEGKGRFMDQIINGVWHTCEMSSWSIAAHLTAQKSRRTLPDFNEEIIELVSGDVGSFLSWSQYFFGAEWDKINPVISAKVRKNIQQRILDPYMSRNDYWWQAFNAKPTTMVNNWNVWCNFNVLTCFLLLEDDKNRLATAVYRTMTSVDQFLNYMKPDGACEEGPSYWGHAAGKLYDYLQLLSDASNRKVNIFQEPMIKNMGEYISRSYVGNDWVVNFADASAKGGGEAGLIYRYGKAVKSTEMQQFAAYLAKRSAHYAVNAGRDFFRTIENLAFYNELLQGQPVLPVASWSWYPQTQFCYMKNREGFFFAAKGGYNNESHNHNDVGTFSLYVNEVPVFVDAGVGTYTKQTFSHERYSIWTMQSDYHNLPMINGAPQEFGSKYSARDVAFDPKKKRFALDIAGAYGSEAAIKTWRRSYTLSDHRLVIDDAFELDQVKATQQVNFLTWAQPALNKPGEVRLEKEGQKIIMQYDASLFEAAVETIPQTDPRLTRVWGNALYRLVLTAKKQTLNGRYKFVISKN